VRLFLLAAGSALAACQGQGELKKKMRDDACTKNLDCAYGLECVPTAAADGGTVAGAGRTCQFHSFGDCEGEWDAAGARRAAAMLALVQVPDGHCTVQCAGHKDCKGGEVLQGRHLPEGGRGGELLREPRLHLPGNLLLRTVRDAPPATRCSSDLDCPVGNRCINGLCQ